MCCAAKKFVGPRCVLNLLLKNPDLSNWLHQIILPVRGHFTVQVLPFRGLAHCLLPAARNCIVVEIQPDKGFSAHVRARLSGVSFVCLRLSGWGNVWFL
jgi:hypothetical protein